MKNGDFEYEVVEGEVIVITDYTGSAKNVVIPGEINGKSVIAIENATFGEGEDDSVYGSFANKQLTSVTIPDSVTAIGEFAFACNQLTSVTIPDSVTDIRDGAFLGNQLTSVTIPDSVTTIEGYTFCNNELTSVTIPGSVTAIGDGAFKDNKLTSVTIPASVDVAEDSFDGNLGEVYARGGKRAGTYTSRDGGKIWSRVKEAGMSRGGMYMGNRIIIVANTEEEMEIGQTLKNLIGKEGIFQAVLWDTKHYKAQEPALPSSQKIIFIGLNECSARNINSIEWKFSALNMRYGWIGSVALIHVLDRTLSKEEKESFKDMCLEQKKEVETLVKSNVAGTVAIAVASAAFGLLGLGIFAAVKIITGTAKEKKELQKRAYHYMITDFLFYGIDEFMEDSENAGI